jgi:putative alpha-1,2-mannosidase
VGELAHLLGKTADAEIFLKRSLNYRKIYDPEMHSMHARDREGRWIQWKGKTEFVPHDVHGLIAMMGKDRFLEELEEFFEKAPPTFGWNPYYNHANEPVHHAAYLFVYAGKPWLTR